MIYKILAEQDGEFIPTGETVDCEFEQTQTIVDNLQAEHGYCCALEQVNG